MYEFLRTKEEKLGPISGTTAALWYPAVLSPGVVASPPVFFCVVMLRIRGFCDLT